MTYRQRKQRRRRHGGGPRSKFLLGVGVLALVAIIGALSAVGYVLAIAATTPDLRTLKPDEKGQTSVIFAADGSRLGYVQSDIIRKVVPVPRDAAGDAPGDGRDRGRALLRALAAWTSTRSSAPASRTSSPATRVQGGSTITQQLVRALYIKDPKRDYARKIREAKLAQELEDEHSKRWILHQYLNDIPYGTVGGRTALGVEAAAVTFFDKHVKDLDLDEAALLAGLPQAPSQYNPFRNPTAALERRNEVLQKMAENGYITAGRGGRGGPAEARAQARHALHDPPRAVLLRLRPGGADREVRRRRRAPRRPAHPHDDRPGAPGGRAQRDRRPALRPGRPVARRSSRSTPPTATSARWPRAARTRTAPSTSPRRATASRARRSRRWC